MIPIDDTTWLSLKHAYGSASEIPRFLGSLYDGAKVDERTWTGVMNCLAHQSTAYDASYAAFPHFINIASDFSNPNSSDCFDAATCILYDALSGDGLTLPEMSDAILSGFNEGLKIGRQLLKEKMDSLTTDASEEIYFLRTISLYRLQPRVAMLLETVRESFRCPYCREEIKNPVNTLCPFPYSDLRA
jgi:hypothetical protein